MQTTWSWWKKFLPLIGLVGVGMIVWFKFPQPNEPPLKLEKIRFGLAMQPASALAIVALEKHFFREVGLDVQWSEFPSGKRALYEGLFSGRVQLITASDLPVTLAALDGRTIRILASIVSTGNMNRIVARKSAGIGKPADLRGKRVATQQLSAVHYFLHTFLMQHRIREQDLQLEFMKAENLPSSLANGTIDAFSMREPYISEAQAMLGEDVIVFDAPGVYPQVDLLVTTHSMMEEHDRPVRLFLEGLLRAESFVRTHQDEAISMVAARLGSPREKIVALWPELHLSIAFNQATLLMMENQARWAVANRLTRADTLPNLLDFLVLDPLSGLKPDAVSVIR